MVSTVVKYEGNYRFASTYQSSGDTLQTDASVEAGGQGVHPTPVHIMAAAMATCALTTMAMAVERRKYSFAGSYAEIGEIVEDDSRIVVTEVNITFHLRADIPEELRKRIEAHSHKSCYVGNSITAEKKYVYVYDVK